MVGPGMFDGLVTAFVVFIVMAFVAGVCLTLALVWLWPYLPSISVAW